MARPAKQKVDESPVPDPNKVTLEELQIKKDQFLNALTQLQVAASEIARVGLEFYNTVARIDLTPNDAAAEPVKKRTRKPKDPNAPKRPLTAYFLYMQTARQKVRDYMGPNATPKEIGDEAAKRWKEMSEKDRKQWDDLYQRRFTDYKKELEEYKKDKAEREAEEASAGFTAVNAAAESEEEEDEVDEHEVRLIPDPEPEPEEESSEEEPTPKKAAPPTPKRGAKKAAATPATPNGEVPKVTGKRGRKPKEPEAAAAESPAKERKSRKRRKSGAAEE